MQWHKNVSIAVRPSLKKKGHIENALLLIFHSVCVCESVHIYLYMYAYMYILYSLHVCTMYVSYICAYKLYRYKDIYIYIYRYIEIYRYITYPSIVKRTIFRG
jgi:hypothetical protein